MVWFEKDKVKIHYSVSEIKGPYVTLINGYTRDSRDFKIFTKLLSKEGFTVVNIDQRGSGLSLSDKRFTLSNMAEDTIEILKYLKIKKTHLIGLSMGGIIAQIIASADPSIINSLCIISSATKYEDLKQRKTFKEADTGKIFQQLKPYFSEYFYYNNKLLITAMSKQIAKNISDENLEKKSELQNFAIKSLANNPINLNKVKAKTLIIHGTKDEIISEECAHKLHKKIKGSKLEIIDNCGHLLLAECPQKIYKTCIDFLKG